MTPRYSSLDHRFHSSVAWNPELPAERIDDRILMSKANSNRHLVTTSAGDFLVNCGQPAQAARHRERFEQLLGRTLDVKAIVYTQSHPDHFTGWETYVDGPCEVYAHRSFPEGVLDRQRLAAFFGPRRDRSASWKRKNVLPTRPSPDAHITAFVDDRLAFELGDLKVELLSAPGGETPDSLFVWLPERRTVFTGNHAGALYLAMPNLTTIRGDRMRSARKFCLDIDMLLALEPELLITGHDEPIRGNEQITRDLTRIRDAVAWVEAETVRGMNEGKSLHQLMWEIELPPELALEPGRAPTAWCVRAVWEEYTGWFRFESPTELYGVPAATVFPDIAELAGADALAARAAEHLAAGHILKALHLTEIVLAADPDNRSACETRVAVLEALIDRTGGTTFDEISYLESELERATDALAEEGA